jgi:Txe/YoeB family toxin of toxin-antitoxin system
MNIEFTAHGWEDFNYWLENDKEVVKKIKELIKAIIREPFKGIGTPEPLKFGLKGSDPEELMENIVWCVFNVDFIMIKIT